MVAEENPYEFGDASTDIGLDEEVPEGCEHGSDAVIVDGKAVSYRSYRTED
ncbi:hypothetical protein [Halosegnis sp.]|uniref:hypothetical protein n=1 Tax=Halosegnis sp. TaxID=2864959 RepID=UPI0035D47900